jgi:hypothetical protein
MTRTKISLKKAVSIGAAFFISIAAHAATVSDEIAKSHELLLNKDRIKAIENLRRYRSLQGQNLKANEKTELNEALVEISTRFLSDKGQRLYELGLSKLPSQPAEAISTLKLAEKEENGNIQIALSLARAQFIAEDCQAAKKTLIPLLEGAALTGETHELLLLVYFCLDDAEAIEALLKKKTNEFRMPPLELKLAQGWLRRRAKEYERARSFLREAHQIDGQNPAVLYWTWRIEKDLSLDTQPAGDSYVTRCRGKEADVRRHLAPMIEGCLKLSEVEADLKQRASEPTGKVD